MASRASTHNCPIPDCSVFVRQTAENLSWHRFPTTSTYTKLRQNWVDVVRNARQENAWEPGESSRICSRHFLGNLKSRSKLPSVNLGGLQLLASLNADASSCSDISNLNSSPTNTEVPCTSAGVVPALQVSAEWINTDDDWRACITCPHCTNDFTIAVPPSVNEHGTPKRRREESSLASRKRLFSSSSDTSTPNVGQALTPNSTNRAKIDHSYFRSPRTAAETETNKNKSLTMRNEALKQKVKRRDKMIMSTKEKLEDSKLISAKKLKLLEIQFPELLKEFVENEFQALTVRGLKGMSYSDEVKKFAVTLHFYSPRAYDFVREHLTLPHPRTLTSWMQSSNCNPGFNFEVMKSLGNARRVDVSTKLTDVVLQVDEMAIRKDTVWDPNRNQFVGFVDYGTGDLTGDEPLATNVLVGLIAGLSGGWKCPIGYIFTDKVDGSMMQQFVTRGFDLLEEEGFRVHAVISDGCSCNVNMFQRFGVIESLEDANDPPTYEEIQTDFPNPANPTKQLRAIYDIVHMAKLMRNLLAQCKDVEWEHGYISWRYILALKILQDEEHIVAANKLDRYHVDFLRHKMKVKLAVQVLSSSVAAAIDFCREDLKLPQFIGSESTARFIREFDCIFDILNSRHPKQHGYKAALRLENIEGKKTKLIDFARKLLRMRYSEKRIYKGKVSYTTKLICLGNRKRAPLGFAVSIKSIIAISEELLNRESEKLQFVLTYRFSQDLLELLFNKVRGRGGRNNNPNVPQFISIMKKIWHQNLLKSCNTGNCIVQMEDSEIPGGLLPLRPRPRNKIAELKDTKELTLDVINDRERSGFYKNCLAYIAGNIVMTISERLKCATCITGLIDSEQDALAESVRKLIVRKDNGGLVTPSQSVYRIVEMTDSLFRNLVSQFHGPPRLQDLDARMTCEIMKQCIGFKFLPTLESHVVDFDPQDGESHLSMLIKSIVKQFLKIRLFDYGKRYQRSLAKSTSSRHSLTKQILFRNE